MIRVLFVCLGNICRSPMAQGLFVKRLHEHGLAERVRVDSAGTHAYHIGHPPDPRAQETVQQVGVDITAQRARQIIGEDLDAFDYVLVMDEDNLARVQGLATGDHRAEIRLFLDFAEDRAEQSVPDPYYGGIHGFEQVQDLIEHASEGLIAHLRATRLSETGCED